MKLTILGSGTSVPHPTRNSPGYWLETENGSILLDCSASAIHRMARENLDWANLDAIWISHFHLDHIGGLAPFLFGIKYAPETQNRQKPLKIFGARGLKKLLKTFDAGGDYKLFKQSFPIEIIEVESLDKFEILKNAEAVALKTPHTAESLAIHICADDKTLVYTSDTGFTIVLGDFARTVDLLLMECSFFKNKPVEKHLELSEAMHIARYAKPKKVLLAHFYPEWDAVNFAEEVKNFSPSCEIIQARDGLKLEI
ncbi:MAG: MBL fold metallo-hydrolase [Pyrinomonadaceae bacterium]